MAIEHRVEICMAVPGNRSGRYDEGTMSNPKVGFLPGVEGLTVTYTDLRGSERDVTLPAENWGRSDRANGTHMRQYSERLRDLESTPAAYAEFF